MLPIMPVGKFVGPKFINTVLIFLKLHYLIPKPCISPSLLPHPKQHELPMDWPGRVCHLQSEARSLVLQPHGTSLRVSVVDAK